MLQVTMLGQFDVHLDGEPVEIRSQPLQLLLAYLLLNPEQTLPREKVAGVLWPDSAESAARKNLRNYVWRLRKAIGEAYLAADKNTLTFGTGPSYRFDVDTLKQGAAAEGTEALLAAVSAYQGELLPGHYDNWIQLEREALRALFARCGLLPGRRARLAAPRTTDDRYVLDVRMGDASRTPEEARRMLLDHGAVELEGLVEEDA